MKGLYISLLGIILWTWVGHLMVIPLWQNPDEPTHFEYLKILMDQETFSLNIQPDLSIQQAIIKSMDRHRYWDYIQMPRPDPLPGSFAEIPFLFVSRTQIGITPPLYYILMAYLLSPVREKSLEAQFYLARGISLCLGLLTLFFSYLTAREVLGDDPKRLLVVLAFIGLLPQFNLVTTSVNPDNLANFLAISATYLLILILKKGVSLIKLALTALCILLGLMTKRTVFMILPLAGVALFLVGWSRLKNRDLWSWAITLYKALNFFLLLVGIYALLTWYFPEAIQTFLNRVVPTVYYSPHLLLELLSRPPAQMKAVSLHLFRSFWYTFGWMKYQLSDPWYRSLQLVSVLALSGLFLFWLRVLRRKVRIETWQVQGLILLLFSCFLALLGAFLDSGGFTVFTQGRYLFPAISAFAILGTFGLYQLVPKKLYGPFTALLILGLLIFNAWAFGAYTVPTFYDFPVRVIDHQPLFTQVAGEIFDGKTVGQTFVAEADGLDGIDVFLATYARTNTQPVLFHLQEGSPQEASPPLDLVTQTFSARRVRDNAYYRFRFPAIAPSKGKSYYFYLESPESRPGNAITAWYQPEDPYKNGSLFLNGAEAKGDLTFKTVYRSSPKAFLESLTQNKPFPLTQPLLYPGLLGLYGLSVLSLGISLKVLFSSKS